MSYLVFRCYRNTEIMSIEIILARTGEAPHPTRREVWDESEDKSLAS